MIEMMSSNILLIMLILSITFTTMLTTVEQGLQSLSW